MPPDVPPKDVRSAPLTTGHNAFGNFMMYSAATWKRTDGPRLALGKDATWTDEDVDRAAKGNGELGMFAGVRCVVYKPEDDASGPAPITAPPV